MLLYNRGLLSLGVDVYLKRREDARSDDGDRDIEECKLQLPPHSCQINLGLLIHERQGSREKSIIEGKWRGTRFNEETDWT
ncbi:hypothetical protein LXL04_002991 [Taraxacum kok-saghyz]